VRYGYRGSTNEIKSFLCSLADKRPGDDGDAFGGRDVALFAVHEVGDRHVGENWMMSLGENEGGLG
jgi:hypothetical protein